MEEPARGPSGPDSRQRSSQTRIRWTSGTTLVLGLVVVVLVVSTPASALQSIAFQLDCPTESKVIQPASAPGTWDCTARMDYTSGGTGLTDPMQPAIVELEPADPEPWMNVIVAPKTIVSFGPDYAEERFEENVRITVALTSQAPAYQTASLSIEPTVIQHPREDGDLSTFESVSGVDLAITPGYISRYDVRIVPETDTAGPQQALLYRIEIDNYSNGPTRFQFQPTNASPRGFTPIPPDPLVVSGGQLGTITGDDGANGTEPQPGHASIPFQVQTPYKNGYIDLRTPLQLEVETAYAGDPSIEGQDALVTTFAEAKGVYVPGPSLPLILIALFAAHAAAGTLRSRDGT